MMTLGTGISRITGFIRVVALAVVLGLTMKDLPDSFNLANITPNIIYDLLIGGVLSSLFIPVFIEYLNDKGEEEAFHVANSVFNFTLLLLTTIAILMSIASPWVIKAQAFLANERVTMVSQSVFLLRFFIFEIVFYGFCAIYTGILNSYKHFTVPAFAPIANNVIVIATVVIYYFCKNMYVLAIGATLGVAAMALLPYPWVRKTGFRYKPVFDLKHPAVRKMGRLAGPVIGYVVINQIGLWVVNILAVKIPGGIAAFQYAYIFFQLPYGIVAVSIITVLFPTLSEHSAKADNKEIIETTSLGIRTTAFIVIPASVGYAVLCTPIVRLLLEHLNFKPEDTRMLATVLFYFVLGLFFFSLFMLVLKVFYSMQDTKTPMVVAAVTIGLNIAIDLFYFYIFKSDVMKVAGLALGNSTAYLIGAIAVTLILRKRLGSVGGRKLSVSMVKTVSASILMGAVCWAVSYGIEKWLGTVSLGAQFTQVFLSIIISVVLYILIMTALRSEEMESLKNLFSRFSRKRANTQQPPEDI